MIPNSKKIYLCTPDRKLLCMLNGIQTETVDFHAQVKGYSELSFTVDRFVSIDGEYIESNGYEDLLTYMYLYLEDIGYFQMQSPQVTNDGIKEVKEIVAYSAEKEFEDKDWKGVEINTGTKFSLEMLVDGNLDEYGFAKKYVTMVNTNEELSFLHLILKKLPWWTIGYVDARIRDAQIPSLEIDNMNLYAVMTSEVAPRLSCIFVFDFYQYQISVLHKDCLDLDTGVFIGFRNLANSISINIDDNSIYTRFTVEGGEGLNIDYYTYGSGQIINLDYFLNSEYPYMEEELADKVRTWLQFQEDKREDYLEYARQAAALQEELDDLYYRVPADEAYWKNWDNMNEEGLRQNLKYYNGLLTNFQKIVDPRPDIEKYQMKNGKFVLDDDGNRIYLPKLNSNGEVDHDWYLQLLYDQMDQYTGYYTYCDIHEYIIPYIELALDNLGKLEEDRESPSDRNIEDPTERWDLYGKYELDGVRKSYEEDLANRLSKYSKKWNEMTEEERQQKGLNGYKDEQAYENSDLRKRYVHYTECLYGKNGKIQYDSDGKPIYDEEKGRRVVILDPNEKSIYQRLNELDNQISDVDERLKDLNAILGDYNNLMKLEATQNDLEEYTHVDQSVINERTQFLFTQDEVNLITTLLHDTDYTNSNIITTSLDTVYDKINDRQRELYEDAVEKLSEVSQPQYNFSVSLDNFFRLTDYNEWYEDLTSPNLDDYSSELHGANALPKVLLRFIRVGIRDNYSVKLRVIGYRYNPCEVTPDLELEFSNMITSKSGRSDLVQLLDQENNAGSKNSISIGLGNSESDQEYISSLLDILSKNTIFKKSVSGIASGTSGSIDVGAVQAIVQDMLGSIRIDGNTVYLENVIGDSSSWNNVFTEYLQSELIVSKVITGRDAVINNIAADVIQVGRDSVTTIANGVIETAQINVSQLYGESADFETLVTNHLSAAAIAAKLAQITTVDADTIFADNIFTNRIQSFASTAATSTVNAEYVKNLVANNITVADLKGDNITLSDNLRIISENGSLIMNGTTLSIYGQDDQGNNNPLPSIQLGYDTTHEPSLIIRNNDGATIITANGITANAIADGLIVNDMIGNGQIQKVKLGFNVVEGDENGNVQITQIYDGEHEFGAQYTRFVQETKDALDNLKDVAQYVVRIDSNAGSIFGSKFETCTLYVSVWEYGSDITDTLDPSVFVWTRLSVDTEADTIWNNQRKTGKQLVLLPDDVKNSCTFFCTVTIDDEEISSGG